MYKTTNPQAARIVQLFSLWIRISREMVDTMFYSWQNVEMLSSLDSAPVRIVKPFPSAQAASRFQSLQQTPAVPTSASAKGDHQRMDTIQEDPSTDSHLDDQFDDDPFPTSGSPAKSFEDLTDHPVTRSEKASSFKLQRQGRVDSKETACWYVTVHWNIDNHFMINCRQSVLPGATTYDNLVHKTALIPDIFRYCIYFMFLKIRVLYALTINLKGSRYKMLYNSIYV